MAFRKMLPLVLLATLVLVPSAEAKYRVGVGDQHASMFDSARWQSLKLKRTRYIVPWNWNKDAALTAEVTAYMNRARAARQQVLVAFTARNGCWNNGRYSRSRACRAPSAKAYRSSFRAFDNAFPWVKTYSAWNEVNHASQPTYKKPGLAVRYYEVLRKDARGASSRSWPRTCSTRRTWRATCARSCARPRAAAPVGPAQLPGRQPPHVGRHAPDALDGPRRGLADRDRRHRRSSGASASAPSRAANRTKWMFKLANRYDSRQRGLRSKITQLYVYRWFGEARGARFDAGLVNPNGSPRKAYNVFRTTAKSHR